jgi:hypothetical protein
VKYGLKVSGKNTLQFSSKANPLKDPIDCTLTKNMREAWKLNEERKQKNREDRIRRAEELGVSGVKPASKRQVTESLLLEARRACESCRADTRRLSV